MMILFWAFLAMMLVILLGSGIWAFGMAMLDPAGGRYWEDL
ncbi:hypothetical protein [Marinobacter sp. Hex_13]|nr:hypothetical protein [Marinobacter sp. Hex_13]